MANSSNAPRTPDDLRGHTFLVHRDMPNAVNHWFEARGLPVIRPVETIQFDSGQLILDAAATDMGIAFMLDTLLANDPRLQPIFDRSEERRDGKGGVSEGRTRWWPYHKKK